ncbi:MAG: ribosome-associated translation inhibitor RaiA [Oscillospiraceae bacterium]|jgi:putative sigma-54 modulation protein|nr:ribosome-associated translation inhibitor RaiA [Oscillospiraceae bacterium]
MKFTFSEKKAQHKSAPPELRDYAEKKLAKIDRFFRDETDTTVTFYAERSQIGLEVTIRAGSLFLKANELTSDAYACVDSAVAAIERQIRKNKTKLAKRLREGSVRFEPEAPTFTDASLDDEEEIRIARTKRFSIKPMSPEEAVLQMNLLNFSFFVFKNENEDGVVSVVYVRKDGTYGIIVDG